MNTSFGYYSGHDIEVVGPDLHAMPQGEVRRSLKVILEQDLGGLVGPTIASVSSDAVIIGIREPSPADQIDRDQLTILAAHQ